MLQTIRSFYATRVSMLQQLKLSEPVYKFYIEFGVLV